MKPLVIRILILSTVVVASAVTFFFTLSYLVCPFLLWVSPALNPTLYDWGLYGAFPSQTYVTNNLVAPRVVTLKADDACDHGFVFLTLNGDSVHPAVGPMILDAKNELVWKAENYAVTTNLKVQQYKGQDFLTFWSGKKTGSLGAGVYYMVSLRPRVVECQRDAHGEMQLDSSYNVAHEVRAVGDDMHGDLHEFKITPDDTALMTIYTVAQADLSPLGKTSNGWITDCVFQEVDIATNELLFEWRASDHFQIGETEWFQPLLGGYFRSMPFDFFHLNSIEKTSHGTYLISSRHTHTVSCLGPDGNVLWVLGGKRNQFTDLSGGDALNFRWQHDARWVSEEDGILTLFDNKEGGVLHVDGPHSRGMMLQVDVANRTVSLLHSYVSLQGRRAPSQGSMQVLPESSHVFIGWGHVPAYSEYSENGTLLCEHHFGASLLHGWDRVVSYRTFKKKEWVGHPTEPPVAKIEDQTLFVSWNGATEVAAWMLQGVEAGEGEEGFVHLDIIDKETFEESFDLSELSQYSHFRAAALGRSGELLGYSEVVTEEAEGGWLTFFLAVLAWAVILRVMWYAYRWFARRRKTGLGWRKIYQSQ